MSISGIAQVAQECVCRGLDRVCVSAGNQIVQSAIPTSASTLKTLVGAGLVISGYGSVVAGAYLAARKVGPVAVGAVIGGAIGGTAAGVAAVVMPRFCGFEDSIFGPASLGIAAGAIVGAGVTKAWIAVGHTLTLVGRAMSRACMKSEGMCD